MPAQPVRGAPRFGRHEPVTTISRASSALRSRTRCLDWSERRPHLAGTLGAALCARSLEENWIRRVKGSRAVTVTPKGWRVFRDTIGVRLD